MVTVGEVRPTVQVSACSVRLFCGRKLTGKKQQKRARRQTETPACAKVLYKENALTAALYLQPERQAGEPLTTLPQAERAIANRRFSVTARLDGQPDGSCAGVYQ